MNAMTHRFRPAAAPIPDQWPLPVFGEKPAEFDTVAVTDDRSEPILHLGETALISTAHRQPINGQLFLIRYNSNAEPKIVQTWLRQHTNDGGTFWGWWTGDYNRPRSPEEAEAWMRGGRALSCCDGPLNAADDKAVAYLSSLIVGKVVGILLTPERAEEPLRIVPDLARVGVGRGFDAEEWVSQYLVAGGHLIPNPDGETITLWRRCIGDGGETLERLDRLMRASPGAVDAVKDVVFSRFVAPPRALEMAA